MEDLSIIIAILSSWLIFETKLITSRKFSVFPRRMEYKNTFCPSARIRVVEWRRQIPMPYHLATPKRLPAQPPTAELLDMRDPSAEAKAFPEVCGETPPATFQFIPATGARSTVPPATRSCVLGNPCTGLDEPCCPTGTCCAACIAPPDAVLRP